MPDDTPDDSRPETPQETGHDAGQDALQRAVNCYLSAVLATAKCIADACPEVGGVYRHKLRRLRARLAFDSSPRAIEESCEALETELEEYSAKASFYAAQHRNELRSAIAGLEEIVRTLAQREDFYAARLRHFASQMEATSYPTEPGHLREVVDLQVAGLLSCIDSMNHESQSLVQRMRNELASVEGRIQNSEVTDSLTGLMNRREMERQIEARKNAGTQPILLHFQLSGEVNTEVLQQVAARLGSQFRHKDLVARWSDTEFMVLFQGPQEIAQHRADQIEPWVAGRYVLDNGQTVDIDVEVKFEQFQLVA